MIEGKRGEQMANLSVCHEIDQTQQSDMPFVSTDNQVKRECNIIIIVSSGHAQLVIESDSQNARLPPQRISPLDDRWNLFNC